MNTELSELFSKYEYYNEESIKLVRENFKEDIDYFKYEF